jgi:hypothetical protein
MTFQKLSAEGDTWRALARVQVYDKALGEAKDGPPIEEFW